MRHWVLGLGLVAWVVRSVDEARYEVRGRAKWMGEMSLEFVVYLGI